jgi:hypothetical protein
VVVCALRIDFHEPDGQIVPPVECEGVAGEIDRPLVADPIVGAELVVQGVQELADRGLAGLGLEAG